MHRVVIFEGIMGSGKSTATLHFADALRATGRTARAVHENTDPHPVRGTDGIEHWYEPWRDLSTRELAARALAKWRTFADGERESGTLTLFDGQLFHGDLTHLFLMEAGEHEIESYCREVVELLRPLDPLLVYFFQADVRAAVRAVCAARGADWVRYQTEWKLKAPYCTRRNLRGETGLGDLYEDYRRLTDRLFERLDLPKLAIDNTDGNWTAYYDRIEAAVRPH